MGLLLALLLVSVLLESPPASSVHMCVPDVQEYQRSFLRPVTAQLSHQASVVASILEQHTAELSAAQEREAEWTSRGLLSRLAPQVGSPVDACVHGNGVEG